MAAARNDTIKEYTLKKEGSWNLVTTTIKRVVNIEAYKT